MKPPTEHTTTYPPSDHPRYGCVGMPNGKHGFCDCWAREHHRRGEVAAENRIDADINAARSDAHDLGYETGVSDGEAKAQARIRVGVEALRGIGDVRWINLDDVLALIDDGETQGACDCGWSKWSGKHAPSCPAFETRGGDDE